MPIQKKLKTTVDYPVKSEYYYIVDFTKFHRLRLYPVYFVNPKTAQRAIDNSVKELKKRKLLYGVVKGSELKSLNIKYLFKKRFLSTKYQYPENKKSYQERKSYRTLTRRRLRRMGLYTRIKPKRRVEEPLTHVRLVKNRQKVANSPNTIAKAFQLERKPKRYYYVVLGREDTRIKGLLIKLLCLQIDVKKWAVRKLIVNIHRNDIIIPYILTQIYEKVRSKPTVLQAIKKEGVEIRIKK